MRDSEKRLGHDKLMVQVHPHIERMMALNAGSPSKFSGGNFCASFDAVDRSEVWIQAKTGVLNFAYTKSTDPVETLRAVIASLPDSTICPDYEAGKYATFIFAELNAEELSTLICAMLRDFYGLPKEATISADVFDMR